MGGCLVEQGLTCRSQFLLPWPAFGRPLAAGALELSKHERAVLSSTYSRPTGCVALFLRSLSPPVQSRKPIWQSLGFPCSDIALGFTAILVAHFRDRSLPARLVSTSLASRVFACRLK